MSGAEARRILGLAPGATWGNVEDAWRRLRKELHPDRHPGAERAYTVKFAQAQSAYEAIRSEPCTSAPVEDLSDYVADLELKLLQAASRILAQGKKIKDLSAKLAALEAQKRAQDFQEQVQSKLDALGQWDAPEDGVGWIPGPRGRRH